MRSTQNLPLVKGNFHPEEAKLVIFNLFTHKINFHALQIFSSEERFGKTLKGSKKRIEELKKSREKALSLIENAAGKNCTVTIQSNVTISIDKM